MLLALAQINSHLGDFARNRGAILERIRSAKDQDCDLVVFPEAALFGYHPCDLLERPSVVNAQMQSLKQLHREMPKGICALVGAIVPNPKPRGKPWWNAAVWLEKGLKPKVFAKQLLPTYDVFDESRHIEPGDVSKNVIRFRGRRILITICEDIWAWPDPASPRYSSYRENPLTKVKGKVDLVVNLSASPFATNKLKRRERVVAATAKHFGCTMAYVNLVGGQDELIFDGASFVVNARGQRVVTCERFGEDFKVIDTREIDRSAKKSRVPKAPSSRQVNRQDEPADLARAALVLGLRDFVTKNNFSRVHLGISGGIDSAVTAALAAEAMGPESVTLISMPGPFSAPESHELSVRLAKNLGLSLLQVPIVALYDNFLKVLNQGLGESKFGVMHENLQARLRALVLMSYANQERSMLLATSNKSELATGYSTLYGDMSGAIMPLGDLVKNEVYALALHYNREHEVIPAAIIKRPPSAELRPNQKDEDSLPPYDVLDPVVEKLVEGYGAPKSQVEQRVLELMMKSEFKRWQAPPILKVSDHAFGRGRRLPLAHRAFY